ncbi:MAG: undecaprenyl-diphosphate phosphatase [Clostridiales bacterium]|nr:undecaprenyl-diphosphate phosphatase [Clostridiales bacterium]
MLEILKAIFFGIVQGITEWLPISSTGHMILLDEFIHLDVSEDFMELFEVLIQLGSIIAVLVVYFTKLNPFSPKKTPKEKKSTWHMWMCVIAGVIPSAVAGILLDDWFNEHFYNWYTVAATLIIYGIAFIVIERLNRGREYKINSPEDIDIKTALLIGCFQVLAIIPGTSRSGSTIIGAMLLGTSRTAAAEFSFFMAIPTMLGASLLKGVKILAIDGLAVTANEWLLLAVASVVAFLVSLAVIKFLVGFVRRHSFSSFGVYRIILGAAVIIYFAIVS